MTRHRLTVESRWCSVWEHCWPWPDWVALDCTAATSSAARDLGHAHQHRAAHRRCTGRSRDRTWYRHTGLYYVHQTLRAARRNGVNANQSLL